MFTCAVAIYGAIVLLFKFLRQRAMVAGRRPTV
jgi:hypothetical protein